MVGLRPVEAGTLHDQHFFLRQQVVGKLLIVGDGVNLGIEPREHIQRRLRFHHADTRNLREQVVSQIVLLGQAPLRRDQILDALITAQRGLNRQLPRRIGAQAHRGQHGQALDDGDQRRGNADLALHGERACLEEADEERGGDHRQRLERAEQRHRHRLEAEAEREALDQTMMDAHHLDGPGKAGERPGEQHHAPGDAGEGEAGIGGGLPRAAGDAQREAERRPPEDEGKGCRNHGRDDEAWMGVEPGDARKPRLPRQQRRLQEARAGLPEGPGEHLLDKQKGDEIEEQRDQHFVHMAAEIDGRGDGRPERAGKRAPDERGDDGERRERRGPGKRRRGAAYAADRDLALGADIDHPGAEAERDPGAGEEIRRRAVEPDADLVRRADGAGDQRGEGGNRIMAGGSDQRRGAEDREEHGKEDAKRQPLAGDFQPERQARLRHGRRRSGGRRLGHAARPAIQRPIWRRSASARRTMATNAPPLITAMRSLIASTSSSSEET